VWWILVNGKKGELIMKEIWVLSVRTSLPEVRNYQAMPTQMFAYDSFPKAREAMRQLLKSYAFSENKMFDGQGNMIYMKQYMDESKAYYEPEEGDILAEDALLGAFHAIFSGADTTLQLEPGVYDFGLVEVDVGDECVTFEGVDDGPINGYNPLANTNMISMQEEKDYYLYLDDAFGWSEDEASSELYMDLKKVTVQ
jgi:hypothetical protein